MELEDSKVQDLLNFLRKQNSAVLATIKTGNVAHAATIYFYTEDDLRFYFLTKNSTMKFTNIKENHSVALVISDPDNLETVQVEGIAREVDYAKEYSQTMEKFTQKLESRGKEWEKIPLNHIQNKGYYVFVQITPTWIRWTDYKDWEHQVKFEQKFPA